MLKNLCIFAAETDTEVRNQKHISALRFTTSGQDVPKMCEGTLSPRTAIATSNARCWHAVTYAKISSRSSSDEGNACGFSDSKAQRERFAEHYDFSATNATVRDEETGFGYFGARYYDSDLLTGWLSVDPMSDKYPSLSPYNYCAWTRPTGGDEHRWIKYNTVNNPIKLADPDGKEVYISGDAAGDAAGQLSSKGITVTRDDATGRLSYTETGKRLSKSDRQLMAAINSKDVRVDVYATNKRNVEIDGLSLNNSSLMGQFLGVSLSDCIGKPRKKIRNAETRQLVNPSICQSRDNAFNVELGTSMRHEITESYQAGRICINEGISCGPSWASWNGIKIPKVKGDVYSRAHKQATPQADVRRIQINESWATFKAEMQKQYGFLGIPILLF